MQFGIFIVMILIIQIIPVRALEDLQILVRSDQNDDDHAEGDDDDRQCKRADKEADVESLKAVVFSIVVAVRVCKVGIIKVGIIRP